jgi:hypothetical protein
MANELFQFTIIDYTTNPLGDSTIIDEPVGWDGVQFELQRLNTHGFVNKINIDGIDFEFYGIAKSILDTAYEQYGTEAKVELQIEWRGKPSNVWELVYKGLFKFNTYEIVCGLECRTKCGIVQDGCYYLFANRKNKSVDLSKLTSFDGTGLTNYTNLNRPIELTPKALKFKNTYETNAFTYNFPQASFKGSRPNGLAQFGYDNIFVTLPHKTILDEEILDQLHTGQLANGDQTKKVGDFSQGSLQYLHNQKLFSPQLLLDDSTKLKCENTYTLSMDIDVDLTMFTANFTQEFDYGYVQFIAYLYNPTIAVGGGINIYNGTRIYWGLVPSSFTRTDTFVENFTRTFTIPKGYFLFYGFIYVAVARKFFNQPFDLTATIRKYDYSLTNLSECSPNEARMSMVNEVLSRQVESYTNDCMRVKSDYFGRNDSSPYTSEEDGCGSLECLLSGLQARGATDQSLNLYPLKSSFDTIFNGLNKIHNLGYGLEPDLIRGGDYKWIRVEPFQYFYQNTILKFCDFPGEVTKTIKQESIFSKIMIGYNKWESIEEGGLKDIFADREYQTNLARANNEIDLRSDLIASDFALEVTRRLYGVSKKDWKYDNDIFILCVKRGLLIYEVETGADILNTSFNIDDPFTLKNARITPLRNLLRHVPTLAQFVKPSLNYLLTFLNGKGNYIAGLEMNNQNCVLETLQFISEDSNVELSIFDEAFYGSPMYSTEMITFKYPMNCGDWADILTNPYGKIAYICPNDPDYSYGYIQQLKFNPTQGVAEITLKKTYP